MGALTYHRNKVWQNAELFWTDVLNKSPQNRRAHTNLGIALSNKGKLTEAIGQFMESLRLRPEVEADYNLGLAFAQLGDPKAAEDHYRKALQLKPNHIKALVNLGVVLSGQKKFEEAASYFKRAIQIDPRSVQAHVNLGFALMNMGDTGWGDAALFRGLET